MRVFFVPPDAEDLIWIGPVFLALVVAMIRASGLLIAEHRVALYAAGCVEPVVWTFTSDLGNVAFVLVGIEAVVGAFEYWPVITRVVIL